MTTTMREETQKLIDQLRLDAEDDEDRANGGWEHGQQAMAGDIADKLEAILNTPPISLTQHEIGDGREFTKGAFREHSPTKIGSLYGG